MGFMGGGFFGSGASESSSETRTTAAETGQQADNSSTALNLSNINTGRASTLNLNVDSVDYGAIGGALALAGGTVGEFSDLARESIAGFAEFASGSTKEAYNFAKDATGAFAEFSAGATKEIIDLSKGNTDAAWEFAGDALDFVDRNQKNAFGEVVSVSRDAMADVKALAEQQATNNDQRIKELAGWAMLAVVVVVVAMFWKMGK